MKHTTWSLLCLFIGTMIAGCSVKSDVERQEWFRYAAKYDKAMNKMWTSSLWEDYAKSREWSDKFLRVKQPTELEIMSLLQSPDAKFKRIGLAAMSIKPIETDAMADTLFGFLQDDDYGKRWYTIRALQEFTIISPSRQADLARRLLGITKTAADDEIIFYMRLFAKCPSDETVRFLAEQLLREGEEKGVRFVRAGALDTLKAMGSQYYDTAANYVNEHGSPEAIERFAEEERSWTRVHSK